MTTTIDLLAAARVQLATAGAPRESIGELVVPRRILGLPRAPRIVPRGTVWHLGVLLLDEHQVRATGDVVRARDDGRRGYTAEASRQRGEREAAAARGGYAPGETVHVGWRVLDLERVDGGGEDAPLALRDGEPVVRWSAAGAPMPLASYLEERVRLLIEPPPRA